VHSIVRKPFEIDVLGDLIAAAEAMMRKQLADNAAGNTTGEVVPFGRTQPR
jgi:hypothetical protein